MMLIHTYEIAKAEAEKALAELSWSVQEIEEFIAESQDTSADRECPACGLVQLEDDIEYCWCCGAELDPDDVDPTMCNCGNPGFTFVCSRWYCFPCIEQLAEGEAEKDAAHNLGAEEA